MGWRQSIATIIQPPKTVAGSGKIYCALHGRLSPTNNILPKQHIIPITYIMYNSKLGPSNRKLMPHYTNSQLRGRYNSIQLLQTMLNDSFGH